MVDETQPDFLQIDEDEDSGVSNFTAFDLLQQPSKFKEELEKQYKVEGDLAEQSIQNYVDKFGRLANYPKTIDLGDPTGVGIFRTPEEREETSTSLSPAYKAGADFFYKIGNKFPELIDNNKYAQLFGSLKGASGTAKFIWKDVHEIFGKMEMGKEITPMEGATALISLTDFSVGATAFTKAGNALAPVSNYLKRLGVPEAQVTTKALKVITENPQHIDEYVGSVDITELSDEAYDKLNLNAAVPPRQPLTAKDEILGLGDDVVPPKNIQETPTLKQEPSPVKSTKVEEPITIDEILETTQKDLAGREAFEGMSPRDIIKKGEEPDPFLTPDEPISAPKQETQTVAKDPVILDLKTKIPQFTNLSDAEKQLVAQRFAQSMLNPAKRKELTKSLSASELAEVERYALEKRLITKETVDVIKQSQKNQPAEVTELNYIGSKQKGGPRSKFTLEADMFLLNNPSLSGSKILEELNSNLNKYGLTDKINTDALKYRKSQLNIPPSDRSKTPPKVQEKKEKLFQEFESSLENIDLEDAGSVFEAFENAAKNNMANLQSFKTAQKAIKEGNVPRSDNRIRSMNTKIKDFINDYNSLPNKKIKVKNLKELKQSQPKSSSGKAKLQQLQFNEFLVKTPEYKKILETYPSGDDKYIKRYLNFVRDSSLPKDRYPKLGVKSQIVEGDNLANFDNFYNEYNIELNDLSNLESTFAKDFKEFKRVDQIRERVSSLLQPYFKVAFPGKSNSVQIAHRFKGSEVGNSVPADVAGSGGAPYSYDLDISIVNFVIQEQLEKQAKKALRSKNLTEIEKISNDAARVGTQFEIDGYKFGQAQPLRDVLESLIADAMIDGPQKGFTDEVIEGMNEALTILDTEKGKRQFLNKGGMVKNFAYGGEVTEDLDIFEVPEDSLPEGSYEVANLMLPFFKLFGKAPVNEVAPIPTPKEKLVNPTKKQKESLDREKEIRSQEDIFDPTPDERVEIGTDNPIELTPLTNQPMTSVFYADIERAMTNAPDQFANKQELLDFLNKNRIKKSEVDDYRINALLRLYDENMPIPKGDVLSQVRSAPISGMRVHATGQGSEMINSNGASRTRYEGYYEPGSIPETQRERILYLNRNKLPGDSGEYPEAMFGGEQIFRHEFGIPNEQDTYIIGWTRLSDRYGFVPPKVEGPQTKINVNKLTKEKTKNERSLQGLYAEARSKIERLANQRGMNQAEIFDILADFGSDVPKLSVIAKYADQLDEISPGLVNQMDELVVKNRDLQEQITKGSGVDPSGVVRVTFADEIQSDLLQAAAGRKQQLAAALRKIQEEGNTTNLQGLNRLAESTIDFYEKNKSVFRPLKKTDAEVNVLAQRVAKMDEQVDEIVNKYIQTREVSDTELSKLSTLLNENLDTMMKELIEIDSNALDGLFPDLPFKNRDEWADALIKKDLYELAYRKFVLKDPDASSYYAVSPSKYVIDRYRFQGNAATSAADRAADKQRRFDAFKRNGEFKDSQYKGIGMDEFYGGPNAVSNVIDNSGTAATNPNFGKPKHYTSTIETILKKQAQNNNSEIITMPVQLKSGKGATQYRVTDQNGNMVATLTNEDQARELLVSNPNYRIQPISIPNKKDMEPVFAIKITPEMLEPYKTHKAQGGLVEHIDIFEVA